MAEPNGSEEDFEEFVADYEQHREALFEIIAEIAEERDIDDGILAALMLDLAISLRMMAYANGVEKPSVQGLKLEMDRFKKEADEHVRSVKKEAETFIADIKADRLAEAEGVLPDED